MRLNTVLIGVQKAGTSSLYYWISQHPEICAPEVIKDYHYFTVPKLLKGGFKFLEQAFIEENKPTASIFMQGGVNYIFQEDAPVRLQAHNSDLKLIVVLRNPVHRARSAHSYFTKLGLETESFSEALEREIRGDVPASELHAKAYLGHGLYSKQLKRYFKCFAKENILILVYEDLFTNKEESCAKIFEFLGVESNFQPDFNVVNETGQVKYPFLNRIVFGDGLIKSSLAAISKSIPQKWRILFGNRLREWNTRKGVSPIRSEIDLKQKAFIKNYFLNDAQELDIMLGTKLVQKWDLDS